MVRGHGNSFQKIYVIGWSTSIVHVQKHHQTDILDFWNAPSPPQLNTLIRGTKIKKISNFLYDSSFQPPLETIWRKRIGLITFLLICLFWVNLYQMLRHQDISTDYQSTNPLPIRDGKMCRRCRRVCAIFSPWLC